MKIKAVLLQLPGLLLKMDCRTTSVPRTLTCLKRFAFSSKNHSPVTILSCLLKRKEESIGIQLFSQIINSKTPNGVKDNQLRESISLLGVIHGDHNPLLIEYVLYTRYLLIALHTYYIFIHSVNMIIPILQMRKQSNKVMCLTHKARIPPQAI